MLLPDMVSLAASSRTRRPWAQARVAHCPVVASLSLIFLIAREHAASAGRNIRE